MEFLRVVFSRKGITMLNVTTRTLGLILAVTLAATLVACSDDDDESDQDTPAPTPISSPTAVPATPSPTIEPFTGGRDAVEAAFEGTAPPACTLVDVRVDEHPGYDRAVFEFADCMPGYRVEYIDAASGCGSGLPEDVAGAAIIQVNANPAQAHNEAGESTIPSLELTPGLAQILELDSTCDFEGYVTWAIGITEAADFRVIELSEPNRIVVDVQVP